MRRVLAWGVMAALPLLSGCGYHLVGSGGGRPQALPEGTKAVALEGEGPLARMFRARLANAGIAVRDDAGVVVRVRPPRRSLAVLAYDASGRPRQYRLRVAASVEVQAREKIVWSSGETAVEDTLLLGGDPAALEAAARSRAGAMLPQLAARLWQRFAAGW